MVKHTDRMIPRRIARVCHACLHKIKIDMWTDDKHWAAIDPKVAFDDLPLYPAEG
jgi:hypothetical protein